MPSPQSFPRSQGNRLLEQHDSRFCLRGRLVLSLHEHCLECRTNVRPKPRETTDLFMLFHSFLQFRFAAVPGSSRNSSASSLFRFARARKSSLSTVSQRVLNSWVTC